VRKILLLPLIALPILIFLIFSNSETFTLEETYSSGLSNCGCKEEEMKYLYTLDSVLKSLNLKSYDEASLVKVFENGTAHFYEGRAFNIEGLKPGYYWVILKDGKIYFVNAENKELIKTLSP